MSFPANQIVCPPFRQAHRRWLVCVLLLFASTINYMDRQVIGILKPDLAREFGWTDERIYAGIVFSFQLAYAIGLLLAGRLIDRIGLRIGFTLFIVVWSLAAAGHGLAHHLPDFHLPALVISDQFGLAFITLSGAAAGFAIMRFLLGLGEAGNFPASIKTVSEWFPVRERALAAGILISGTNFGALAAPLAVPWLTLHYGWEWAFLITGAVGFILALVWWLVYRPPAEDPVITPEELAYIRSDPPQPEVKIKWRRLFRHRQTWAFAVGKFMTDPIWWMYLFWVPDFLHRKHGLDLKSIGLPLIVIYLLADVGSVVGGWLSSHLIKGGWTPNRSRKTAMFAAALCVVPIIYAAQTSSLWVAVCLVGLAASAHQGWSANLLTLPTDMYPRPVVGSVVGIGGMAGSVGGMTLSLLVGEVLQRTGSYQILWYMAALAYPVALLMIHLLVPRLEPATFTEPHETNSCISL